MIRFSRGNIDVERYDEINRLERKSCLAEVDGHRVPNVEFIESLATLLSQWWKTRIDASQAWQVWIALDEIYTAIGKQNRIAAEIGYWYGIDPFRLNSDQIYGLHANLNRLQAQQRLKDGNYDPYDFEAVYDLTMVAFDDDSIAIKARSESMKLLVKRETAGK